ncbi:MAG: DNA-binding transcriptional regulator [Bacteroidales bacterium]|nr:DNA-binding transcriptional regulator [Bacteroidales bacterium]MDD2611715.1 DNA-binding transcriptional regulator [Bacteroidales bacterium]MDD3908143.1 DNA-binding transcriptional regulator [Bacteroidales bacterium]MDD4712685.1 DNA-binding transcriptional regulator [Bacteroidales bacterium]MEA4840704.1 DNA-binding transcriptional regulator [Bacteroidales bacterium]
MTKILILIDYSSEFSRELLKGIIQYSKDFGPWTFYRLPSYYKSLYGKEGIVKWAKKWGADAIIAQWDTEGRTLLKELDIPVILQNYKERSGYFSNLTGDYTGTGAMAARFFSQKGFKNFAFYGNKDVIWSMERRDGFKNEVEKIGGRFYSLEVESIEDNQMENGYSHLDEWLLSLPKPIALFACDDNFALQITETCKINNINIPNDISLLGVDNDELICNLSDPPISSIVLDVQKGGYEAGRLLHQLIRKERSEPFNIVVNPVRIEARLSTEKYVVTNKNIMTVIKYIEENFASDISITDFTKLVPLSRRLLEIKFKEELGTSIYQFIINFRIEYFANLLLTTDQPLYELALQSGFNDCKNISRTFKKLKNCTPLEFKHKFGSKS